MEFRTDLAVERAELTKNLDGIEQTDETIGKAKINRIKITNETGAAAIGKPIGTYITIEIPPLSDNDGYDDDLIEALSTELYDFLPRTGLVLIIGLGNTDITPDALGPETAAGVLATRHISEELARSIGLNGLRPVAVMSPGVLGQTGIETSEITRGIVDKVAPSAVIVIDALASRKVARLGCTVQLANTGISPGAGVGNKRRELSLETLGVPVISIGVPTVVDATTLAYDLLGEDFDQQTAAVEPRGAKMIVTPREIDLIITRAAHLISHSINVALQPQLSSEDLLMLTK